MAEKSKDGIGKDTSEKLEDQDDLVDYECDLTLEMNKELSIYLGVSRTSFLTFTDQGSPKN